MATLSWLGVVLVLSVILLSGTRTGIILAALSTMIYVMVNRGTGFWQLAISFVVIGGAAYFGMGAMGQQVQDRFATLGSMQDDGSFQGRVEIYQTSVGGILSNPLGSGLGATGLSGRVGGGTARDRRRRLFGNHDPTRLDWNRASALCAMAHVAGDGNKIPSGIQALRGDARQSVYDRPNPGLFRRESHHHVFDSLDRVRRSAGSKGLPCFRSQAATDEECGAS